MFIKASIDLDREKASITHFYDLLEMPLSQGFQFLLNYYLSIKNQSNRNNNNLNTESIIEFNQEQKSLVLLILSAILIHSKESIDWMIRYDLVDLSIRYFQNTDIRIINNNNLIINGTNSLIDNQ
ncbi:hypothetical protein ACTFIY_004129 [Dictyostelium cf. discoideum]